MCILALFIIKSNLLDVNIVTRPFYNLFFFKKYCFLSVVLYSHLCLENNEHRLWHNLGYVLILFLIYIMFYQDIQLLKKYHSVHLCVGKKIIMKIFPKIVSL